MDGKSAQEYQAEIKALAGSLPFPPVELPEFSRASYSAPCVRQPRTFVKADASMQAVGRFLVERGTVELLRPEQTLDLFTEIYWCSFQIRQLGRRRYKSVSAAHAARVEARRLISRIEAAEEELFIANRRMVVNCIKPYYWIGQMWLADFLQEASKALANSVRKFDATRGTPFYAYAQRAVQNRLRNFFRDHVRAGSFGVRPSREMQLVKNIVDTWKRDYEENPTDEIVAKIADIPADRVNKVRAYISQWSKMPAPPVSLDALFAEDGGNLHEVIEDEQAPDAVHAAEMAEVWQAIESLPDRSRHIMKLRFIEGRTLEETGKLLKLTRARIKQIQDSALKRLRQILKELPPES